MQDRSGKAFEYRVAEAYQALDYQVTHNVEVAGRQTDLLVEKEIPGASKIILAVECKDHDRAVGSKLVDEFSSRIVSQCAAGAITRGVMVSRRGFTPKARAAADSQKDVTLLSLEELTSQIFDVRLALRELVEHYEKQEIFQDYLPLKVEVQRWSTAAKSSEPQAFDDLMDQLIKFDSQGGVGVMIVLADFGAGKTTLLQNIAYHRAKAHLDGEDTRLPLFVRLRDFSEAQDVGVLLQASFRNAYHRELPLGVLWQRIESGRFYLLLDGFDEMVDRSDAARRLELFQALIPLLRSPSPVMLTSRPSYLVERGELNALLAELRTSDESTPARIAGGTHTKVSAERLRRELYEQMREDNRYNGGDEPLDAKQVRVVRLQSLDQPQVEEFVARHSSDLEAVGSSVSDVTDFIDRTYDLGDLATRPMLLRLIVKTVVIGGLDLTDTGTQYGASGLYEMYTHAKLDFDVDKIRGRNGGLDVDTRRRLAESLALEMYLAKTLETDFQDHLQQLVDTGHSLGLVLKSSRLSEAEIATDLAARSFVTLDEDGVCRFIHKSFRGFFVARILKQKLPQLDPLFKEPIEDEVLYFLGGFAPTEKRIGDVLWQSYKGADPADTVLRRNLLVAYLHTKPGHGERRIGDVEIFEAEFGHLHFRSTPMTNVSWRDATVRRMDLVKVNWKAVRIEASEFRNVLIEGSEFDFQVEGSSFDTWSCEGSIGSVTCTDSTIDLWDIEDATLQCKVNEGVVVKDLALQKSNVNLQTGPDPSLSSLGKTRIEASCLRVAGNSPPERLEAVDSLVVSTSKRPIPHLWDLRKSVLLLPREPGSSKGEDQFEPSPVIDRWSIILAPKGIHFSLLETSSGMFGSIERTRGGLPPLTFAAGWGVLEAEEILEALGVSKNDPGCRLNRLLLVSKKQYYKFMGADLNAVRQLQALASDINIDFRDPNSLKHLDSLRKKARSQYEAIKDQPWPNFTDLV